MMVIDDGKVGMPGTPDFMSRLRDAVKDDPKPGEVEKYAPLAVRERKRTDVKTKNQTIAEFILALPYMEAMKMGKGVLEKLHVKDSSLTEGDLTAAIQAWAWEWETWEDEQRPGSVS